MKSEEEIQDRLREVEKEIQEIKMFLKEDVVYVIDEELTLDDLYLARQEKKLLGLVLKS